MPTPPDFTAGTSLAAASLNAIGLWLIDEETVSAANSIVIDGCFTDDFTHYFLTYSLTTSTTGQYTGLQLRASGTPKQTNYDRSAWFTTTGGASGIDGFGTGQAAWYLGGQSTALLVGNAYIYQPKVSARTGFTGHAAYPGAYLAQGSQTENYSADGFQILAQGNAATYTGTVYVYGLRD